MPPRTPPAGDAVVLTDPRAIRAVAHPARLAIIDALFDGRELTATECSALTGLSASATSYHLKALARWGIVAPADRRADGRDRPWRAVGRTLVVDSDLPRSASTVSQALLDTVLERDQRALASYVARADSEPPEWQDAVNVASSRAWLTPEELAEVVAGLRERLEPYRDRRPGAPASRRIRITLVTVPADG